MLSDHGGELCGGGEHGGVGRCAARLGRRGGLGVGPAREEERGCMGLNSRALAEQGPWVHPPARPAR
jgi:hypothetical protein